MDGTLLLALATIPALVIAIVFHEVSHGWMALALGDPTAKEQRRLSLNPIRHIDLVGTILLPGMLALSGLPVFGWAKPVPVNKWRLRNPRFGMMAVAVAGPGSNLLQAAIAAVALGLLAKTAGNAAGAGVMFVAASLQAYILINIFLALFNMLPIPPFDGSHIVEGLLPRRMVAGYERLRPLGFPLVLLILVVLPWLIPTFRPVESVLGGPVAWLNGLYFQLIGSVAGQ
jgi:Zn-dependent protease